MATFEKRIGKTGKTTWRAKVRKQGVSAEKTFSRRADADRWAKETELAIERGEFEGSARGMTVAQLIDRTIAEYLPTKRHNKNRAKDAVLLAWWREELGKLPLAQFTPKRIQEARAKLLARKTRHKRPVSSSTVNRYVAALSQAGKYGWKVLHVLPRNPVLSVERGAEHTGVIRYLSDAERDRLMAAAAADPDPNLHVAVTLALATGLRAGNLTALEWADVDFASEAIRIRDSKNGQGRWVPLIGPALKSLRLHLQRDPTGAGHVFKSTTKDKPADVNGAAWLRVKRAAGLPDFRFHDLRHTAATWMHQAGATDFAIADALGHRTLAMARRYSHESPELTRATLAKLEGRVK